MELLVNVDVDDLDRAEAFYTRALDLKVGRRFGRIAVELLGCGAPIYLLLKAASTRASPASEEQRRYRRHWTPVHLDFVTSDLDAVLQKALAAGAVQEGHTETHKWGRIAYLADPFGHGICLLQFLGKGYDEISAG